MAAARLLSLPASQSLLPRLSPACSSSSSTSSHGHGQRQQRHLLQATTSALLRRLPPHPRQQKCREAAAEAAAGGGGGLATSGRRDLHHLHLLLLPGENGGHRLRIHGCRARREGAAEEEEEEEEELRRPAVLLYALAGVYVLWLFILPYAPGDPVWAIKPDTVTMIIDLSLNFLYILPFANLLGVHLLESPVVHPTAEALFNFVIGWSLMFAPLLFTDKRSDRFKGSLLALWGVQMFLTNVALIPYMAIRLSPKDAREALSSPTDRNAIEDALSSGTNSKALGIVGALAGLVSIAWFFVGRPSDSVGDAAERWAFFLQYLASDRLGYAFIWDICLYTLFQPWLIGDNLSNIDRESARFVRPLRYVPYIGLVAYLWALERNPDRLRVNRG